MTVPFIYQRQIHWGETDTAGIVYTGQFLDFMLEAVECWWREVVGLDWYRMNTEFQMGSPMVSTHMDFIAPVYDGDLLDLAVIVERLGGASIKHKIVGTGQDGVKRFEGSLTGAIVNNQIMKAVRIPDDWRQKIAAYKAACESAPKT
ncbi:MAG: acyl-CoA thioesterase [Alphaproteobacteria bacterium]|jgi:4-hydroxybenzoyl-CoA thioesterase|nr:acyl-CoA thioesterase [Alphaproteobacteria bacterium]MBT4020483.1 acyl-CoA thioesterase [Alphaproteobacteria bacterium]MBT4964992.1 acyl-CoA thioesterase [Alphaproteobacteria bacterium]MBT5158246.1 acyl-CoA thioesterase [Alphaproteobacteria bacterium]MBT6386309.1 acyl-CoA thioesterase [Alphaproteobacteria bacterium]